MKFVQYKDSTDFFGVKHPGKKEVLEYIRRSVKYEYRFYEEGMWYVHRSAIPALVELATSYGVAVDDRLPGSLEEAYAALHLTLSAPVGIVKAAWKELAKQHHPDKGGDERLFKHYQAAYLTIISSLEG